MKRFGRIWTFWARHVFQAATSCLSNATCSSFTIGASRCRSDIQWDAGGMQGRRSPDNDNGRRPPKSPLPSDWGPLQEVSTPFSAPVPYDVIDTAQPWRGSSSG